MKCNRFMSTRLIFQTCQFSKRTMQFVAYFCPFLVDATFSFQALFILKVTLNLCPSLFHQWGNILLLHTNTLIRKSPYFQTLPCNTSFISEAIPINLFCIFLRFRRLRQAQMLSKKLPVKFSLIAFLFSFLLRKDMVPIENKTE